MSFLTYHKDNAKTHKNVNFTVSCRRAYTEDNVMVYNLFLYKIPNAVTESDLRSHFERFGKIQLLRILKKAAPCHRKSLRVGFVHFEEADSAYRALLSMWHVISGKAIGVKACDSWHQPEASQMAAINQRCNCQSAAVPLDTSLLLLDDYCLLEVCKHLDLRNLIKFARVCLRFAQVFRSYAQIHLKHVSLTLFRDLTLWEVQTFFQLAGATLEKVTGNFCVSAERDRIMDFILMYAGNLKVFRYDATRPKLSTTRKLVHNLPLLEKLEIRHCSMMDSYLLPIQHLKHLKTLTLSHCYALTGSSLQYMKQLTHLYLYCCFKIRISSFLALIDAMPHLCILNIQRCNSAYPIKPVELEGGLNVERLELSYVERGDYSWLRQLPKLREVELLFHPMAEPQRLCPLLSHLATRQLEHLKLIGRFVLNDACLRMVGEMTALRYFSSCYNASVTAAGLRNLCGLEHLEELVLMSTNELNNNVLLQILRSCPKLRCLQIQRCPEITPPFVKLCLNVLKAQQPRSSKEPERPKLYIYARYTGISHIPQDELSPLVRWDFREPSVLPKGSYLLSSDCVVIRRNYTGVGDAFPAYYEDQFRYGSDTDSD